MQLCEVFKAGAGPSPTDVFRGWKAVAGMVCALVNEAEKEVGGDRPARAAALRDQVLKTWNPPQGFGAETAAQIAQTSVMQTLAWVFGKEFLPDLTYNQRCAIDQGLALFEKRVGMSDLLGGARPLNLPPHCTTHHNSCDCREAMIRQGLEWIARDIRTSMIKRDDAPCSAETHLQQALRMCVDLRNRVSHDSDADQLAVECWEYVGEGPA